MDVVAAVLMEQAVQVGTFRVAKESNAHRNFKDKILKAKDIDTIRFSLSYLDTQFLRLE